MSLIPILLFAVTIILFSLAYAQGNKKEELVIKKLFVIGGINFLNLLLIKLGWINPTLNFFGCYAIIYAYILFEYLGDVERKKSYKNIFITIIALCFLFVLYQYKNGIVVISGFNDFETLPGIILLIIYSIRLLKSKNSDQHSFLKTVILSLLILGCLSLFEFVLSGLSIVEWNYWLIVLIVLFSFLMIYIFLIKTLRPKSSKKYVTSALSKLEKERIAKQVDEYLKKNKPYLKSDFSLSNLSEELELKSRNISEALNSYYNKSFLSMINEYRIEEALRLMKSDTTNSLSIKEIMYSSGFKTKSSFYRYFNEIAKMTPEDYRKHSK